MLNFSSDVPSDPRGNSLPLMRCPSNRSIEGIITCEDLVGTRTHYYRGRTIPCDDAECPACSDGFPWRWHAYVSVYSPRSQRTVLFEMTARCAETLVTYRKAYSTLRGCHLIAKRANTSPNSRVNLQTKQADLQSIALPASPNILEALSIIWNIELPSISLDGVLKETPRMKVKREADKRVSTIEKSMQASRSQSPNGEDS